MLKWERKRGASASWYRISVGNDEKLREFVGLWLHYIMNVLNVTDSLDSWNAKCYNTYTCMHAYICTCVYMPAIYTYVHLCTYVCHNKNNSTVRKKRLGWMDGWTCAIVSVHGQTQLRASSLWAAHSVRFLCILQSHWDQAGLQLSNPVLSAGINGVCLHGQLTTASSNITSFQGAQGVLEALNTGMCCGY